MGLADVLGLTFAALACVKAWDVEREYGLWAAVGWVVVTVAAPWSRWGWAALSVTAGLALAFADTYMQSTQTGLICLVAMVLACPHVDRAFLLRTQVVAVYLFAALNKVNPDYLAGDSVARRAPEWAPVVLLAIVGLAVEAWLAWAVWRRYRHALPLAAAFHASIIGLMGYDLYSWTLLASYNLMMVVLVWWVVQGNRDPSPRMLAA